MTNLLGKKIFGDISSHALPHRSKRKQESGDQRWVLASVAGLTLAIVGLWAVSLRWQWGGVEESGTTNFGIQAGLEQIIADTVDSYDASRAAIAGETFQAEDTGTQEMVTLLQQGNLNQQQQAEVGARLSERLWR